MREHGPGVFCGGRHGLLAQYVQPPVERSTRYPGVVGRRCCDIEEVQPPSLGGQQRGMIRVDAGRGELLMRYLAAGCTDVGNGCDFDCPAIAHVLGEGRRVALASDGSVANYRAAQWSVHVSAIASTRSREGKPAGAPLAASAGTSRAACDLETGCPWRPTRRHVG